MLKTLKLKYAVKKPHVKKDDLVVILSGEDAGKKGRVLQVLPGKGRVVVEGISFMKRHQRPSKKIGKGGIVQKEGSIALSRVALILGDKVVRAVIKEQGGELVRVDSKSGENVGRK